MKRRFKVTVERSDEYVIELDDEVMNDEWLENFRNEMYEFDDLEEHAEHIAQARARFNNGFIYGGNIEGYGDIAKRGCIHPNSSFPFPAVNIIEADEDNEVETFVREI